MEIFRVKGNVLERAQRCFSKAKCQAVSFFPAPPFSFKMTLKTVPFLVIFNIIQLVYLGGGKAECVICTGLSI